MEHTLVSFASIIVLGISAQWLAWRLRLPSILLLLIFGFLAGPATGFIRPDVLLGDLTLPVVSLAVALILFEGGLSLSRSELREIGGVVRNLISIGVLVTWLSSAAAAYFILDLSLSLAILFGAILVVTGPTVIVPLLRHVRPSGRVGAITKWEGIMNDPIGAILAVIVFEAIIARGVEEATTLVIFGVLRAVLVGGIAGVLGAGLLILLLKRYWVPDFLQEVVTLMVTVSAFTISNLFQTESGLLAVTVMGVVLANQKLVPVKHIIDFKENLRVLLISSLFILLAARLQMDDLTQIHISRWTGFLAFLILIVRPATVVLSTFGSDLNWRERAFLSWMAPRGIVAAAVSSVFALHLVEEGHPQARQLVPLMFFVIVGTVAIYGLTATPVARWLKLAQPNPQGVLIVGAHALARAIASALKLADYKVLLVDTNRRNIHAARMDKLPTYHGSILSEYAPDEIELDGIGRLLALTSNDEANSLAALHFAEIFDRAEVYQLLPEEEEEGEEGEFSPQHLRGRFLFGPSMTYTALMERFNAGAAIKTTSLTQTFDYDAFFAHYGESAIPLFLIDETGDLMVFTTGDSLEPQPGQALICLVEEVEDG